MTQALPSELGICDRVLDALCDLITDKMQTQYPATEATRVASIKVGPQQDDPRSVLILLHENDPENPSAWPHRPQPYREMGDSGQLIGTRIGGSPFGEQRPLRQQAGYQMVGGSSRMARAFSADIEVWGNEFTVALTRRQIGQIASIVENRLIKTLNEAGPKIGTGDMITDDFGESVQLGPFWGDGWTDQEEGEALIARKRVSFYYVTIQAWGTGNW